VAPVSNETGHGQSGISARAGPHAATVVDHTQFQDNDDTTKCGHSHIGNETSRSATRVDRSVARAIPAMDLSSNISCRTRAEALRELCMDTIRHCSQPPHHPSVKMIKIGNGIPTATAGRYARTGS
jgi:hypothetical protein